MLSLARASQKVFPKRYALPLYRPGQVVLGEVGSRKNSDIKPWRQVYGEVVAVNFSLRGNLSHPQWYYTLRPMRVTNDRGWELKECDRLFRIPECCIVSAVARHKFINIPPDFQQPKFTLGQQVEIQGGSGGIVGMIYVSPFWHYFVSSDFDPLHIQRICESDLKEICQSLRKSTCVSAQQ